MMRDQLAALLWPYCLSLAHRWPLFANCQWSVADEGPARDRERANPYLSKRMRSPPVAASFVDHCAHCHGEDADGTKKRPSLRSAARTAGSHRRRPALAAGERQQGSGHAVLGQAGRSADLASHHLREVAALIEHGVDLAVLRRIVSARCDETSRACGWRAGAGGPGRSGQPAQSPCGPAKTIYASQTDARLCQVSLRAILQELPFRRNRLAVVQLRCSRVVGDRARRSPRPASNEFLRVGQLFGATKSEDKLEEICEQVTNGDMPDSMYLLLHREAAVTQDERGAVCQWTEDSRQY